VVLGGGLAVDLVGGRVDREVGRRIAAERDGLDVLRSEDRAQPAAAERALLGRHDRREPDFVLARRPDHRCPVGGDVVFVVEIVSRLRDGRSREARYGFELDAVVAHVEND